MSDQAITLLILVVSVGVFVWNRLPVGIVALGVSLSLWAADVISLNQMVEGFGSPTVVLIAALFVVAEALDAAGVTTWAGQQVSHYAGDSRTRLMVLIMVAVALLSALITPNGAVAALFPMVVVLVVRMAEAPSRYLMPLAFAVHAGALLVLTGSPVTLLVSEAAEEAGAGGFSFFEPTLVGVPLLVGTMLVVVLLGSRLLPQREAQLLARDLSRLPATLAGQYIAEDVLARLKVSANSPLIGTIPGKVDIPASMDVHLVSVQNERGRPQHEEAVRPDSVLVVRGSQEGIEQFATRYDLARVQDDDEDVEAGLVSRDFGVAEVIVAPRSTYVGRTVFPGMVTDSGRLVVLAVQRYGEDLGVNEVSLRAGDSMLLQGGWDALDVHTADPNVVVVDSPDAIRRQTVPLGPRAVPALVVLGAMVVVLTTGLVPAVVAGLGAAIAMVLLRVVSVDQAHQSMSWTTLILVAGMIPLSTAITETGTAESLAEWIVDVIGDGSPYLLLAGLFLVTAALGQMISNTATALIVIPIAVSVVAEMDMSVMPVLMCVNVAAAASLLTPVATPANTMVMGPAGYQFGDYWKLGLAVMAVYFVVGVFLVPVIWPL